MTRREGTYRPYDVFICQSSNLGWGASMHFLWAWLLMGVLALLMLALIGVQIILKLPVTDFLLALVVPFMAPAKEIIDLWNQGMAGGDTPPEQDLRDIQDKILQFRQNNPYIPDWLDSLFHGKNEAAMRSSVQARVEEARRRGHVVQQVPPSQ